MEDKQTLSTPKHNHIVRFDPINNRRLADLCGPCNANLQQIEQHFKVKIHNRSNQFEIAGKDNECIAATAILKRLYKATQKEEPLTPDQIHLILSENTIMSKTVIKTRLTQISPRGKHQQEYVNSIREFDMNFAIGPAGTGKTYLAVACAVEAIEQEQVQRIILVRPAVEAGENLGFLPGDMAEKVNPYLRPLYDALYEMMGFDLVAQLIEQNIIEIAPLAFMRGRTLNDAFVILDEAQNTTIEQMKMFLTRIGFGSTAVITGDSTQIDLPKHVNSGLTHASSVLADIDSISFSRFTSRDAVRHPLVQKVIEAYEQYEADQEKHV